MGTPDPVYEARIAYLGAPPQRLDVIERQEHVAVTFRGMCETCPWEGADRRDSLIALRDYDRHVLTATHGWAVINETSARSDDEQEADDATA